MNRRTRIAATALVAAILGITAVASAAVFPTTAYAAAVPSITTMGGPINVLPSAVQSAASGASEVTRADVIAAYMYRAAKSPEFWALYAQAQKQAAATGKPLALTADVASEAKTVYPLASKAAPLIKGAGAAGAAITAYEVSSQLTNGVLNLVGFDATGTVCTGTGEGLFGKAVQVAAGVHDCSSYGKIAESFIANGDASGGYTMVLTVNGQTVNLVGIAAGSVYGDLCFTATGGLQSFDGGVNPKIDFQLPGGNPDRIYLSPDPDACSATDGSNASARVLTNQSGGNDAILDRLRAIKPLCIIRGGAYPGIGTCTGDGVSSAHQGSADPTRTLKCVTSATDGKTYVQGSDGFTESAGVLPNIKCADLPPGVQADSVSVLETGGDSGDQTIWQSKSDPSVLDATSKYGTCGTTTVCPLVLFKDGQSCFDGADCTGWARDTDSSRYTCKYGTYAVAMTECQVYKNRWEQKNITSGNTLTNPKTGDELQNPAPTLSPGSQASLGAGPHPELGSYNCWPSGWGAFNPGNWILQPIKCAFIPREGSVKVDTDRLAQAWGNTTPFKLAAAMGSFNLHPVMTGCDGILVPADTFGPGEPAKRVANACDGEPLARGASMTRTVGDIFFTIGGIWAIASYMGWTIGYKGPNE